MCKHCDMDKGKALDKGEHVFIAQFSSDSEKGHELFMSYFGHCLRVPINYCPICGQRLEYQE